MISTQRLTFATIMGALGFAMQMFVPGIPIGMTKFELADLPAVLGAAFAGPTGGGLIGFLYGLGSGALPWVPLFTFIFALLGYLSKNLKMGWMAIPIARGLVDPFLNAILAKIIYYGAAVPLEVILIRAFLLSIPGVIISVPLYIFIEKKTSFTLLLR